MIMMKFVSDILTIWCYRTLEEVGQLPNSGKISRIALNLDMEKNEKVELGNTFHVPIQQ